MLCSGNPCGKMKRYGGVRYGGVRYGGVRYMEGLGTEGLGMERLGMKGLGMERLGMEGLGTAIVCHISMASGMRREMGLHPQSLLPTPF